MKWELKSFDEIGFIARGKSRHRPRNAEHLYGGEYPFIQTGDIKAANFRINDYSQTYNEAGLAQSKLWKEGTLCITIAANIADTAILGIDACFPDSVIGFVPYEEKSDVRFVKYFFDIFQARMKSISTGAAQDNLSLEKLLTFKIPTPPLPTQRKIASILSAYDDLIENNLKRIKLLEEKAQLHYKELISDGNNEKKYFEEFCSIIHGYAFKSTDFSEDKTFDIVVRMGNFKEGGGLQFDNNTKYLNEHFEYNPKYKLEANDLVMVLSDVTREGRIIGNVGFIPSNDKTYLLNQRVGKIVSDKKYKYWLYATFNSKEFKDYCLSCANSATVLNFNNKDLFKFKITIPKETELRAFTKMVKPIFTIISTLGEQNSKLREARDILLPRLMNRQIAV